MMIYTDRKILKLTLAGLMAALVFVGSAQRITIPVDVGTTSFHLGNIMCALAGMVLGPVWGGLSAAVGSMLYDFTNPLYISESWITFLTKGAYGLVVGLVAWGGNKPSLSYRRALLATSAGAAAYAALYLFKSFAWSGLLVKGLQPAVAAASLVPKLPATIFNAVIAIILAPMLALAIQKALSHGLGGRYQRPTKG